VIVRQVKTFFLSGIGNCMTTTEKTSRFKTKIISMRDKRFVAEHRGGPLSKEQHRQLMKWAIACAEHVLPLCGGTIDDRLIIALNVAREWEKGNSSAGKARIAALGALAVANESIRQTAIFTARSVGHAVATAHMADHSMQAAAYALKTVKASGISVEMERKWQDEQLQKDIIELVLSARENRNI
jgi:hypothetical protein